jgi:mono/diheme cytochrome c family protein/glucose/arabinose dehydrogenase
MKLSQWRAGGVWLAATAVAAIVGSGFNTLVLGQAPAGAPAPTAGARGAGPAGAAPQAGRATAAAPAPGVADAPNVGGDYGDKPAIVARTPQDQLRSFVMPPGYSLELVLADPDIVSPAVIAWDGNGRLYVAEARSYMLDVDAGRQHEATSRISMHESTKGDGVYDKHTVFADNLLFPRMILPLENGILTNETHSDDVLLLQDTNGDGVADRRSVFYTGVGAGRSGNIQQAQSGFVWGLDNWIYSTYNAFRFRWTPRGIVREPSGPPGAEWGMSMDDDGKIWLVNAAGERGPANFQIPIQYGAFMVSDQWEAGFEIPHGLPMPGDMQGGLPRVRVSNGSLAHFTSPTGPEIVRSNVFPADLNGDLLFAEPVGRIIRRAKIVKTDGLTQVRNAYQAAEFIASSDPLFRPVNIKVGPDGGIYIVDMYHGIIQDANWTARGTYLRYKIQQYQLDKVVGRGRIWRLKYDGIPAGVAEGGVATQPAAAGMPLGRTQPRMLGETSAQLVAHLTNPNGWWRDTAQRLLVLKQDKSVVPALQQLARGSQSLVGRFHALWTLEGLGALDPALAREMLKDTSPRIRIQALRASESLFKAGNRSFEADYKSALGDADTDVAIQAMLTLSTFKPADFAELVKTTQTAKNVRGVRAIGDYLLTPAPAVAGAGTFTAVEAKAIEEGKAIYESLCYSCHGGDGRGATSPAGAALAPSLAGSPRVNGHRDYITKVLLRGLTGPLSEGGGSDVMLAMGTNNDQWVSAVSSYVRSAFGNPGGMVTATDVARVRAATLSRKTPYTLKELEPTLPRRVENQAAWKLTASHNTENASAALLAVRPWSSNTAQAPGMWFQIELPQPVNVTELEFDSPAPAAARGGGAGRAGGGPAPAPPQPTFPRGYQVEVSLDGVKWGKPVVMGKGSGVRTSIAFAPQRAKFVKVTQTDTLTEPSNWVISSLKVYEAGPGK